MTYVFLYVVHLQYGHYQLSFFHMNPNHHLLRHYRKKYKLTLEDIATLLGNKPLVQVSRSELRPISRQVELSILYHLIFNEPIEQFFKYHKRSVRASLILRLQNYLDDLPLLKPPRWKQKQEFFSRTLATLNQQVAYDKQHAQQKLY